MSQTWKLQDAKQKFSQMINEAIRSGPQVITKHGTEIAVVLAYEEYRKLLTSQQGLVDFFRSSPLVSAELDLTRDKSEVQAVAIDLA